MNYLHTFTGNPLDRGDVPRRDSEWIASSEKNPRSLILPLWNLKVLLKNPDNPVLAWLSPSQILEMGNDFKPMFLGLKSNVAHFTVDVSILGSPIKELKLEKGLWFEDARMAASQLTVPENGILAQSRSQVDWHNRNRFCGLCGELTTPVRGGQVRMCNGCQTEHFPRTDPVVIMLVHNENKCLLGQSHGRLSKTGMYSALAGFMDQGESIEEAVRREVMEESGITVGAVNYHSSQPWPFPSSLMIGCHAKAESSEIVADKSEMADVRWFEKNQILRALADKDPELKIPAPIAIAHHLIKSWAENTI